MNLRLPPDGLPTAADRARAETGVQRWLDQAGLADDESLAAFIRALPEDADGRRLLEAVFGNSPFLTQCLLREPAFLRSLLDTGPDRAFEELLATATAEMAEAAPPALMRGLRATRRRAALLVALADISGAWDLARVTGALSALAEWALSTAVAGLLRDAARRGDVELAHPDTPEHGCGYVVIGMGKLGARELNYSSDIDLIVLYDPDAIRYTGRKTVQEYSIRLTRDLIRLIEERTADGYVFRTDLRLRPDPGATPPAISIAAAETYYEAFGQNWERAALIKARVVAGDAALGKGFLDFLRPFIWRKSLDFAAIQDIHSIKRQINAHKGGHRIAVAGHNIKLGRGGIREIEFFAQTQQLIWGGRQPEVRAAATCEALRALAAAEHIADAVAEELIQAYGFLRRLEHRLQMIDDQQTQTLPREPERLTALAVFMGYEGAEDFAAALRHTLERVEDHYAHLFEDAPDLASDGNLVFTGGEDDPDTIETISRMGFNNPKAVSATIRGWHHGRVRATRSTRAREMLTELVPALLRAMAQTANPDAAFMKFNEFLTRMPAGVPLFSMFYQNPHLLDLVAEVMGDAPRLAEHLSRHPNQLESVLETGFFDPPAAAEELSVDLDRTLAQARDFGDALDLCRRWTNDHRFQIGIQTLRKLLVPEAAAQALTDVADTVLSRLHPRVEQEFARTHGHLPGAGVAIVALGKMGSREMTATSDLDLIFIYEVPEDVTESDGPKPLSPSVYFARLTQRMINALTVKTPEGVLYEVDMRLRPSGNAGPIASSLEAFERYHEEMAWTWEHMALTRARVVSGPPDLAGRVRAVIRHTLSRRRDPDRLLRDVAEMRERMAREHRGDSPWDVKYRPGGLVDIDFLAQYLLLRHAAGHHDILVTQTASMIDRLAKAGALAPQEADDLTEALRLWTAIQAILRQTVEGRFDAEAAPPGLREALLRAADAPSFGALVERMEDAAARVRAIYDAIIATPARALGGDTRKGE